MITNLLKNISNRKLQIIAFVLVELLVFSPIVIMLLNALPLSALQIYNSWYTLTYFVGCFGLLVGGTVLIRVIRDNVLGLKQGIISLLPLLLLLLFGMWCLVCDGNSRFIFISFLSFENCLDGFFMCVTYFGILLLGLALSENTTYLLKVAKSFLVVSLIQTTVSLMNNGITDFFCKNEMTTTTGYESVYYNTNHFAYYLVFSIMVSAFLFIREKKVLFKIIYLLSLAIFTILLVLNNTLGSHLAVLLTMIFMSVWAFANKENNKVDIFIVLVAFVGSSCLTLLFTNNICDSYVGLFTNVKTLLLGQEITGESINSIGSGRGMLWKFTFEIAKQNPIFGIGAVNAYMSAHNIFLQIAMQFGFVGLTIYLSMLITGAIRLFRKRKLLSSFQESAAFCVVAYLISAFFGVTMFYTAPYYYLVLGVCFSAVLKDVDESDITICSENS